MRSQTWEKILLAAVLLICFAQFHRGIDFRGYYETIVAIRSTHFRYVPYPTQAANPGDYFQSPLATTILIPFTYMPLLLAKFVWAVLNLAGVIYVFKNWFRTMPKPRGFVFLLLFFTAPLSDVFMSGNFIFPTFVATFVGWRWLHHRKINLHFWGGLLLAAAIAIRLFPAVFLLWFVFVDKRRELWWIALGLVVCFAVTVPVFGGDTLVWWKAWFHSLPLYSKAAGAGSPYFQSPPAIVYRWLTLFAHIPHATALLWQGLSSYIIAFGISGLALLHHRRYPFDQHEPFVLMVATLFLANPFAWPAATLFLFPMFFDVSKKKIPKPLWICALLFGLIQTSLLPRPLWEDLSAWGLPAITIIYVVIAALFHLPTSSRLIP
jgi:hypothetical protein